MLRSKRRLTIYDTENDIDYMLYYKTIKNRKTRHFYPHPLSLQDLGDRPLRLVPVKLDLEWDGYKIKDAFTWNLNETCLTPEMFAQLLADDYDSPIVHQLIPDIIDQIRKQVLEYGIATEDDPEGDGSTRIIDEEGIENQDFRIVIKIDLIVGNLGLKDQFEWPLFSTLPILPEDFAKQMTADLGISSEFIPMISHSIREQVAIARLNFEEAIPAPIIKTRPLRLDLVQESWGPEIRIMTEDELEKIVKEQERSSRRMRRQRLYDRPRSPAPPPNPSAVLPENTPLFEPNLQAMVPSLINELGIQTLISAMKADTAKSSPINDQIDLPDGFQQSSPLYSPTSNTFKTPFASPKRVNGNHGRSLLTHDSPLHLDSDF